MKKKDLVVALKDNGVADTLKRCEEIVDFIFERISEELSNGGEVNISKFGKFSTKVLNARTGINPSTKEKIQLDACNVVKFKAHKGLRDRVQ